MKKIFFIILLFCSYNAIAQKSSKIDSIYYLIDTANTPVNDRMWEIHEEYPSFKIYIIQCPCLQYDQKPSLIYDTKKTNGKVISQKQLKALKLTNIAILIVKIKQSLTNDFTGKYVFFLVEPLGKKYIFHEVRTLKPRKPRGISIDYENIPGDTTKTKH
ncbi:MAG: hypothetical protein M3O71_13465 [Bacteroidota bacterium]|nr:hypothetical protein [Bacteroidota bacterium]